MASYQRNLGELTQLGVTVIGATVENRETAAAMASEVGLAFPIAYGVSEQDVAALDPWWADDHHGEYLQPMEFLVLRHGIVFGSLYASGPIGRMDVEEVLFAVRGRERRRTQA